MILHKYFMALECVIGCCRAVLVDVTLEVRTLSLWVRSAWSTNRLVRNNAGSAAAI